MRNYTCIHVYCMYLIYFTDLCNYWCLCVFRRDFYLLTFTVSSVLGARAGGTAEKLKLTPRDSEPKTGRNRTEPDRTGVGECV